jgi:putative ABC transport system substrate-binding protein
MRRREFIAGLGGAAAVWPLAARAQQLGRRWRIGALMAVPESDLEFRSYFDAFVQELALLGWAGGRNIQIDQRWGGDDVDRIRAFARELVGLQPDVILSHTTPVTAALQRETRSIPIVFTVVGDPVGSGFVAGLPRPDSNLTGFISIEARMTGKWLQMIGEIAHGTRLAELIYNPETTPYVKYYQGPFEAAAQALAMEAVMAPVDNNGEIESSIEALGRKQGCLVILPSAFMDNRRATVAAAAMRNKVPAIAAHSFYARDGVLLSYGPNFEDIFRRAAGYVDRILKGYKPAELPVQVPAKFDLLINLKTAKALGLTVPAALLVLADEVIE